ncbi:hypothetical protein OSB04_004476 [Centaurea solstitialis]|uniref:Ty3 transposon capsid-like protein domain-containing protein n=1 Tax=Centaurea solstitialis TaxID=347529 RepID=A0AA38U8H9_9ASTR|nr:hypothetical protein OSB04_004476 [Centaurea solstitialis]
MHKITEVDDIDDTCLTIHITNWHIPAISKTRHFQNRVHLGLPRAPVAGEAEVPVEVIEPQRRTAGRPQAAGRGRGTGRGRGRGRGRAIQQVVTLEPENRQRVPIVRQAKSVADAVEKSEASMKSSTSVQVICQGFVTKEAFDDKMERIEKALQTLLKGKEKVVEGEHGEPEGTKEEEHSHLTPSVKMEFTACKPPAFSGDRNPVLALRWLGEIEIVFETCKCAEDDKVIFVLSLLKGEAMHWWTMESGGCAAEVAKNTSSDDFTKRFRAQFCSAAAIKKLEEEFLNLEQGSKTVKEYTTQFIEKARFAALYVPTEERMIERYIWGLRSNIRELMDTRNPSTFRTAIDAAELTEREKEKGNRAIGQHATSKGNIQNQILEKKRNTSPTHPMMITPKRQDSQSASIQHEPRNWPAPSNPHPHAGAPHTGVVNHQPLRNNMIHHHHHHHRASYKENINSNMLRSAAGWEPNGTRDFILQDHFRIYHKAIKGRGNSCVDTIHKEGATMVLTANICIKRPAIPCNFLLAGSIDPANWHGIL